MLVMFSTYDQTKLSSGFRSGEEGGSEKGYKDVALLLKPSLGLFGLVGRRRVLLPHLGSATGHLIAPGDMIEGSYRSWDLYTTGQLVDGLQQKKKTGFH